MANDPPASNAAHVIVLGNEKGGSGKSTLAMHIIVALLKAGHRVASIDTDSRQLSLTRYLENRARWARRAGLPLELPAHFSVRPGEGDIVSEMEAREFADFAEIIDRLGETVDFVVIDTPANDSYRMRLSHALADTLVTPVNDSFIDLDVLGRIEGPDHVVTAVSQYAALVEDVRRKRLTERAAGHRLDRGAQPAVDALQPQSGPCHRRPGEAVGSARFPYRPRHFGADDLPRILPDGADGFRSAGTRRPRHAADHVASGGAQRNPRAGGDASPAGAKRRRRRQRRNPWTPRRSGSSAPASRPSDTSRTQNLNSPFFAELGIESGMLRAVRKPAHVIVLGNEKGGSGKSHDRHACDRRPSEERGARRLH